jgi:hypothetical protein
MKFAEFFNWNTKKSPSGDLGVKNRNATNRNQVETLRYE